VRECDISDFLQQLPQDIPRRDEAGFGDPTLLEKLPMLCRRFITGIGY
jgi:hypothetical protein